MKLCNLASGSKGNATLVFTDNTSILIDDGISLRQLKCRCKEVGFDYTKIDAIFITHEHIDHVKGADSLSKELEIPVYIQPQSLGLIKEKFGAFNHAVECPFIAPIEFDDLSLSAFRVSHDAIYTQGFSITDGNKSVVFATDLGNITKHIQSQLEKADYVFLESNYDKTMLLNGAYPKSVKSRILGRNGHLSNEDCANEIVHLHKNFNKTNFMLAHISQNNNSLDVLKETFARIFKENNVDINKLNIEIALQDVASKVIEI